MKISSTKKGNSEDYFDIKHLRSDLKQKTVKSAGFTISSQIINYGIQTFGTIILARLLTPNDFGLIAMVATFSLFIQNFGVNGIMEAIIQWDNPTHLQVSRLFWIYQGILLVLTGLFIFSAPLIVSLFKEPRLRNIAVALSATIILGGLTSFHLSILSRNMKFHIVSAIRVSASLLSTVVSILFALKGLGYWSLVLRRISEQASVAIFVWLLCRWRPKMAMRTDGVWPIMIFAARTYVTYLIDYFRKNVDKILIGKVYGTIALGHYDRAYQLSAMLPNQLTVSLSNVGVAALSRLRNDPPRYLNAFANTLSAISLVGFPGSVFLTLLGKEIIIFLLGQQWGQAGDIFVALGPAVGLAVIYNSIIWLHLSLGKADRLLKWAVITLILSIGAYSVGIIFGLIGVAVAYSAFFYVLLIPALVYAGKPIEIRASFFIAILWRYWLAAFLSGGLFYLLLMAQWAPIGFYAHLSPVARIIVGFPIYGSFYLVFILAFFKGLLPLKLFGSLIRDFFSKSKRD